MVKGEWSFWQCQRGACVMKKRKKLIKTDLKIETNHVLNALAIGIIAFAAYKIKKFAENNINKINPASRENVVFQGVERAVGADNVSSVADRVFGAVDLINPFNESDDHARQVWGLDRGVTNEK